MTPKSWPILKALADWTADDGWARPLDLGGTGTSGHSVFLRRMAGLGWLEVKSGRTGR